MYSRPLFFRHSFSWALLQANSCVPQLRVFCFPGKLQDQPFQVLLALLAKPGDVVTREELRAKLWPADTFVDFDHGLNAAVKRLQDALGDTAENPRFIETLARRAYRFLVPLQGQAVTPSPAVPTPVPLPAPFRRRNDVHW